ncbi:50S ribosomal protein L24 [Candidatus Saccharibacteria bacterium]|nr:50S ribosomal protein L24 [Candidatus Saccharibacteria bacterium]MBR0482983.1 50S ribosomal protein L24 [Candidatus Saccharibacteria bacterium]
MGVRIKTGDTVKIISGADKGKTGKVIKVMPRDNKVLIEGIGNRERHMRKGMNGRGGKKDIQVAIDASKVALVVDAKTGKTSRIGYAKNDKGETVRIARQANNKEVK